MRLNGKRIVEVMEEKSLTEETVCSRTGLYQKSFGKKDKSAEHAGDQVYPGSVDRLRRDYVQEDRRYQPCR